MHAPPVLTLADGKPAEQDKSSCSPCFASFLFGREVRLYMEECLKQEAVTDVAQSILPFCSPPCVHLTYLLHTQKWRDELGLTGNQGIQETEFKLVAAPSSLRVAFTEWSRCTWSGFFQKLERWPMRERERESIGVGLLSTSNKEQIQVC